MDGNEYIAVWLCPGVSRSFSYVDEVCPVGNEGDYLSDEIMGVRLATRINIE